MMFACVAPEEPLDGLIENLPAVVNTNRAFTLALKASEYSFEETYSLSFNAQPEDQVVLTLVVSDVGARLDTTELIVYSGDTDSLINHFYLMTNQIQTQIYSVDSTLSNVPTRVDIKGNNYTGQIDFVLALQ
jgi:hypothetical protein